MGILNVLYHIKASLYTIFRPTAARLQLHRSSTSPPSLWPGRELRKYHCPSAPVVARPVAIRSLLQWLYRSAFSVMAGLQPGSEAPHLIAQGMYLSGCVFSCQGPYALFLCNLFNCLDDHLLIM